MGDGLAVSEAPGRVELPPSVAVYIADVLEEWILTGQLAPGTPLLQLDLAARFGVSRVPIRDALHILEQRDLVVRVPRRGFIVRPITVQSVRDIFAVRRLLEAEAVRLATPRLSAGDLVDLERIIERQRQAVREQNLAAARAADREFHAALWQACGNEVLRELAGIVWRRVLQARSYGQLTPGWGERSLARHERILAALRCGDVEAAVESIVAAISAAEQEILAQLERSAVKRQPS